MHHTILLVEDEAADAETIRQLLEPAGYRLLRAKDCAEGWRCFEADRPDVVVLDLVLPDGSGVDICRRIRSHPALWATPVIMLTVRDKIEDKLVGFRAGADHYLPKPVHLKDLHLWVNALLRRVEFEEKEGGILRVEGFVVDPGSHTVTAGERVVANLTRKEFDLLYELVRRRPRVLSKEFILSRLWQAVLRDNTVAAHIKNLRDKLGEAGSRIATVPGAGYKFD